MMCDVEKVGALEMRVAARIAGPQLSGINRGFHSGALWSSGIEVQRAVDVFERSAHVRNHHVAHTEFSGRVSRLEGPTAHWGSFYLLKRRSSVSRFESERIPTGSPERGRRSRGR